MILPRETRYVSEPGHVEDVDMRSNCDALALESVGYVVTSHMNADLIPPSIQRLQGSYLSPPLFRSN